LLPEQIYVHLR